MTYQTTGVYRAAKQTMDAHVGCYGTMRLYTQLYSAMSRVHKFMGKMVWVDKGGLPRGNYHVR